MIVVPTKDEAFLIVFEMPFIEHCIYAMSAIRFMCFYALTKDYSKWYILQHFALYLE